jgi:16S rRNA (guanine(966)-N(2))-methyltransferase RsmD
MRIVGGKYKGRFFNPGKKFRARPTTDIAKEGLFNILENRYYLEDKKILDLFSGTGSIGYEFASRGCKNVIMVEKNFNHAKFIRQTLENLTINNAKIIKSDSLIFVKNTTEQFDIIFADPPYDFEKVKDIPDTILSSEILKTDGILILEHSKDYDFSRHSHFTELRQYGKVNFSFFNI